MFGLRLSDRALSLGDAEAEIAGARFHSDHFTYRAAAQIRNLKKQILPIGRVSQPIVHCNDALAHHPFELAVKYLHAFERSVSHGVVERLSFSLSFFDVISRPRGRSQHLESRNPAVPVYSWYEALRNYEAECAGKPHPNDVLLTLRKHSDQPLYCLDRVCCMQG